MIVFDVPVRRVSTRINGEEVEVLEIVEGFWQVLSEGRDVLGKHGQYLISNPLIEAFLNQTQLVPGQRLAIRLVPAQFANEGTNDEQASLNNQLGGIV